MDHSLSEDEPATQCWTLSGYPIVDGKYLDKDGNIRQVSPGEFTTAGPPALDVFWVNRQITPGKNCQFRVISCHAFVTVTEYMRRMGELLN
jgi:hypothetical protein